MRIKFEGKRTLAELREELEVCLKRMDSLGIKSITGANLYFTPCNESGDAVILELEDGRTLDGWVYPSLKKRQKAKSAEVVKLAVNNDTTAPPQERRKEQDA
jgi:hypothetical protein